jgi:uncharacterized protein YqeY
MTIFQRIKDDRDNARKARDQFTVTTLSTIIGEIQNKVSSKSGKDVETETQKALKATIDACNELYSVKKNEKSLKEIEILEMYVIKNMSTDEVKEILAKENFTQLKDVMQHFKSLNVPVDMNEVRKLFQESQV